jgi:hypothetical protein
VSTEFGCLEEARQNSGATHNLQPMLQRDKQHCPTMTKTTFDRCHRIADILGYRIVPVQE